MWHKMRWRQVHQYVFSQSVTDFKSGIETRIRDFQESGLTEAHAKKSHLFLDDICFILQDGFVMQKRHMALTYFPIYPVQNHPNKLWDLSSKTISPNYKAGNPMKFIMLQ